MHATVQGAIGSAVDSISSTLAYEKLKEDINLVRRYVSLSGLPEAAQKRIVEYLDPLGPRYDKKIDASACLIGFDFDGFSKLASVATSEVEHKFKILLEAAIKEATAELESRLSAAAIHHHVMEVFFLPVESVNQLRIDFQNRIGWKS